MRNRHNKHLTNIVGQIFLMPTPMLTQVLKAVLFALPLPQFALPATHHASGAIFCSSSSSDSRASIHPHSIHPQSAGHSRSRSVRSLAIAGGGGPYYGNKHGGPGGGSGHNGTMLGMGGPQGMAMPMQMGLAMHMSAGTVHMGGPMHMGGGNMVGSPMNLGAIGGGGGGKDYASMAKESFPLRGGATGMMAGCSGGLGGGHSGGGGGRGFLGTQVHHHNGGPISRPVATLPTGKDYASLASGGGTGSGDSYLDKRGGGSGGGGGGGGGVGGYLEQAQPRDVRKVGRVGGAGMSGRPSEVSSRSGGSGGAGAGGHGGRFDRAGGKQSPPSPPPPLGRDQFGRERDWRGNVANGRRAGASPSSGQVTVV